jgi:comEA protein
MGVNPADWTRGPAKWAAVSVVAVAAAGAGYFAFKRPAPVLLPKSGAAAIERERTPDEHESEPPGAEIPVRSTGAGDASDKPNTQSGESRTVKPALATRVNINTASAAELDLLPGIGPALAKRIVEDREKNGHFARVDDIVRVKGIGPKTLEKLRALITVE